MGKFSFTEEKIWDIIEGLIDERVMTFMEGYKNIEEYTIQVSDIKDSIEDLAWDIENDMRDSL